MYTCSSCHQTSLKWAGKCPNCGEWNTLEESYEKNHRSKTQHAGKLLETKKISKDTPLGLFRYKSDSPELDGVLGGGLIEGSLVLLSGEPGIGKSTLALQMAEWYANGTTQNGVLYISGEEHIGQISARAKRLNVLNDAIDIITENYFDDIIATLRNHKANIVIIDSLSVLSSDSLDGVSGSISQIRSMTEEFMLLAKNLKKSIILIGHVTKDGTISGPKVLEHLVDVVLYLEGVRTENYRILRALKNRFGSTDAVGLFRMEETGLIDLPNPGLEFVDDATSGIPGSALTLTVEGNRPLLIEIEALTTYTKFGYPKRSSRGIPQGKLDLLIAVLTKFSDINLESYDVYINVARGFNLSDPGVDLATIASLISSKSGKSLGRTIYLGEVSLTGIIKNTYHLEKRVLEAAKLGFKKIIIPKSYTGLTPKGVEFIRLVNITELQI
ncbi:MAG: DNA repair protein RadA [Candidatus Altimarinota bacterium]